MYNTYHLLLLSSSDAQNCGAIVEVDIIQKKYNARHMYTLRMTSNYIIKKGNKKN